jgi:hypothetical protein
VDYGSGASVSYTYDAAGNLLSRQMTASGTTASAARKTDIKRKKEKTTAKPAETTANRPNGQ